MPLTTANRWRGEAYGNSKAGWQSDALRVTDPRSDCACRRLGAVRGCAQKEGWTLAQIIDLIKHRGFPRQNKPGGHPGRRRSPSPHERQLRFFTILGVAIIIPVAVLIFWLLSK